MAIIEAVLRKLLRSYGSVDYDGVIEVLGGALQTNINEASLRQLINQQVAASDWDITTYVVSGRGQTGGLPSFAMPGYQLYMYVLNEESVTGEGNIIRNLQGRNDENGA